MAKTKKRVLSLLLALVMALSLLPTAAFALGESSSDQIMQDSSGNHLYYVSENEAVTDKTTGTAQNATTGGNVTVSKTIAGTNNENEFLVTLEVQTKQKLNETVSSPDAAVVLVLDRSGSMSYCAECGDHDDKNNSTLKYRENYLCPNGSGEHYEKNRWTGRCENCGQSERNHTAAYICPECGVVSGNRMMAAKAGAIAFVDQLLEDTPKGEHGNYTAHRYISLVSFSSKKNDEYAKAPTVDCNWVDVTTPTGYQAFVNAVNNDELKASGGTYLQGGLELASTQMKKTNALNGTVDITKVANRYTIVLTDGEPTYSKWHGDGKECSEEICEETAGTARSLQKLCQVYAICYGADSNTCYGSGRDKVTVGNFLQSITHAYYSADNSDQLNTAFGDISDLIALLTEAWQVTDPMGEYIQFGKVENNGHYTQGNTVASCSDGTLVWDLKSDIPFSTSGTSADKTYTYKLCYTITLDTLKTGFQQGKEYAANGYTYLTYVFYNEDGQLVDENGNVLEKSPEEPFSIAFNIPAVHGYSGGFDFTKKDKNNPDAQFGFATEGDPTTLKNVATFTLTHSSSCGCGGTYTTQASTVNNKVEFANIPSGHIYTMTETVPAGYDQSKAQTYTVTVAWGKVTVQDASGSVVYTENKAMTVENELDPQEKTLTVTKTWLGGEPAANTTVTVNVTGTNESGEEAFTGTLTISKQSNGTWSGTLTVPTVDVTNGEKITYSIEEEAVSGWKQVNTGGSGLALTLTNARSQDVTYSVEKKWVGPEADKKEVVAKLMNGDTEVDTVTLNSGNSWKGTFKTVDAYDNSGNPITYTVKEFIDGKEVTNTVTVNDHSYNAEVKLEGSIYVIYNTVAQDNTAAATGTKTWKTSAITGATATFELLADGQATGKTVTLNQGQSNISFSGLPKYALPNTVVGSVTYGSDANGHEIVYTFKETATTGAPEGDSITSSSSNNKDFTNTLTGPTSVTVTKVWEDNLDAEGLRPDSITVKLMNGATQVAEQTLRATGEENTWLDEDLTYTFTGLQKYDANGALINYTVTEDKVDNYGTNITGSAAAGYTITNTLNAGTTTVTVSKVWVDTKSEHESVTINIMNGNTVAQAVTLPTEEGEWTATVELPLRANGAIIDYTVEEASVPTGYTSSVAEGANNTFTVYNVIDQDNTVSISATKTWEGGDENHRPVLTFTLLADGSATPQTIKSTDKGYDPANITFSNLPKYDYEINDAGQKVSCKEIQYSIQETMDGDLADRYDSSLNIVEGVYKFTNTFDAGTTTVNVTKTWVDGGKTTHSAVKVGVFEINASGEVLSETPVKTAEITDNYSFTDLPAYNTDGTAKSYKVYEMNGDTRLTSSAEITIGEDTYVVSYGTGTITNTLKQETVSVPVNKVWQGPAAESVTFNLLRNGTKIDELTLTKEDANEDGTWSGAFEDLDKYDSNRNEYRYTVEEVAVTGYTSRQTGGNTFINTVDQTTTSLTVVKEWIVPEDGSVELPASVKIQLYADGSVYTREPADGATDYTRPVEITAGEDGTWTYTFENLPKYAYTYDEDNNVSSVREIVYTAAEEGATLNGEDYVVQIGHDHYEVTYAANESGQWVITNDYIRTDVFGYRVIRNYFTITDGVRSTDGVEGQLEPTLGEQGDGVSVDPASYTQYKGEEYTFKSGMIDGVSVENFAFTLDETNHIYIVVLNYERTVTTPTDPPYIPPDTPDPPTDPEDPGTEIPEEPTPGGELPEEPEEPEEPTDIPDENVPEGELPEDIPDEDVPQGEAPKTGDNMSMWLALSGTAALGLVALNVFDSKRKKKEHEEQ